MNIKKRINHKDLWFNSMTGMTLGFISTLIVGTIIGIFGLWSKDNIFVSIKKSLFFLTSFAIGIGVGIKNKLRPIEIIAIAISSFIVGKSMFIPHLINGKFIFGNIYWNIDFHFNPGDVFAAWLSSVFSLYFFQIYKLKNSMDIIFIPIIGIFSGVINAFWITYCTTMILIIFEWIINNSINKNFIFALLLTPIFSLIMGLALSLPTSSAAIAFSLGLKEDAAIVAIAATSAQMISFGVMTYMNTKNISKSLSVGLGTSMLQMNNYIRKPLILIIPCLASIFTSIISLGIFHDNLKFHSPSATSGMGTCAFYGQIFTIKENGISNIYAWTNVIFMQLFLPLMFTIPLTYLFIKKKFIKKGDLMF